MKRLLCILLCLCLVLSLCACGGEESLEDLPLVEPVTVEREEIPSHEANLEDTDKLIIWASPRLTEEKEAFQKLYPDVKVETWSAEKVLQSKNGTYFPKSLADGTGNYEMPDLILWSDSWLWTYGLTEDSFLDIYHLMDSGALLDLKPLMENDPDFDESLYDARAMEACRYRGGQYLMPLQINSGDRTLLASQETLTDLGFDLGQATDAFSFLEECRTLEWPDSMKSTFTEALSGRYFQSIFYETPQWRSIFDACDVPLVDHEAGIVLPDEKKFRALCQTWKKLFYSERKERDNGYTGTNGDEIKRLTERESLFAMIPVQGYYSPCALKATDTPVMMGFPNADGGVTGEVALSAGICALGKNQKNAWNFLKFLMGEEGQKTAVQPPYSDWWNIAEQGELPVHLRTQEEYIQWLLEKTYADTTSDKGKASYGYGEELTEEEKAMAAQAAEDLTVLRLPSLELYLLFVEHMKSYFVGESDYMACVETLQEALAKYLQGGR